MKTFFVLLALTIFYSVAAYASAPTLRSIEATFGLYPGRYFVSPQLGATIQFMRLTNHRNVKLKPGEYAIIVRKAD
jgi:hypothetical protein